MYLARPCVSQWALGDPKDTRGLLRGGRVIEDWNGLFREIFPSEALTHDGSSDPNGHHNILEFMAKPGLYKVGSNSQ